MWNLGNNKMIGYDKARMLFRRGNRPLRVYRNDRQYVYKMRGFVLPAQVVRMLMKEFTLEEYCNLLLTEDEVTRAENKIRINDDNASFI